MEIKSVDDVPDDAIEIKFSSHVEDLIGQVKAILKLKDIVKLSYPAPEEAKVYLFAITERLQMDENAANVSIFFDGNFIFFKKKDLTAKTITDMIPLLNDDLA